MTEPTPLSKLYHKETLEEIQALMARCGQALFDDSSCSFGGETWNRSANSFEADAALSEVAEILGINGPTHYYDKLCEESSDG